MTPPEPIISIIIPTYNYSKVLPRAVLSVLTQMTERHELIVIDDGSTDDTPQILNRLEKEHAGRFKIMRKENGGASSARNCGITESCGLYLIFLDADDELANNALTLIEQHLSSNPETRLIIGGHCSISGNGTRKDHLPAHLSKLPLERVRSYLLEKQLALSNGACVMHRDIFTHGDYPEAFRSAEDIPVFAQALANYPCSVIDKPLALIHKHNDSLRHQFNHAKAGGIALVDEVFSPQRLGEEFQILKSRFYVKRCLSLFRSAYIAGDTSAGKDYFLAALKKDWKVLLKSTYVRKALRLWIR